MKKKTLVTDGVHPVLLEGLTELGYEIDYQPDISLSKVQEVIPAYEGLIVNSKIIVDQYLLDRATQLKFVGRLGSGMEIIDQVYAKERGVAVLNSPAGNCNAVAEHALGMLLALANNFLRADGEVRQQVWEREKNRGFEIMGRTIGIVGFGHTGSSFASKLSGMGMKVLAYDKYKTNYTADYPYVEESSLEKIQEQADIISFHLPLTPETKHYVDATFIDACKKGVIFINTSRGQVIDTYALVAGLEKEKVGGACLDVFENEKPRTFTAEESEIYGRLYEFDNLILSPHVAGWTFESKRRLAAILIEKITRVLTLRD